MTCPMVALVSDAAHRSRDHRCGSLAHSKIERFSPTFAVSTGARCLVGRQAFGSPRRQGAIIWFDDGPPLGSADCRVPAKIPMSRMLRSPKALSAPRHSALPYKAPAASTLSKRTGTERSARPASCVRAPVPPLRPASHPLSRSRGRLERHVDQRQADLRFHCIGRLDRHSACRIALH
jgi:hypothetical protein